MISSELWGADGGGVGEYITRAGRITLSRCRTFVFRRLFAYRTFLRSPCELEDYPVLYPPVDPSFRFYCHSVGAIGGIFLFAAPAMGVVESGRASLLADLVMGNL